MKKIMISAILLASNLNLSAQETKDVHEIYCTPDIEDLNTIKLIDAILTTCNY